MRPKSARYGSLMGEYSNVPNLALETDLKLDFSTIT